MRQFSVCFLFALCATFSGPVGALSVGSSSLHTGATTSTGTNFTMGAELKNIPTQTLRVTLPENQPDPAPVVIEPGPIITSPAPGSFVPEPEEANGSGGSSNGTVYRGSNKGPRMGTDSESFFESAPSATDGYVPIEALTAALIEKQTEDETPAVPNIVSNEGEGAAVRPETVTEVKQAEQSTETLLPKTGKQTATIQSSSLTVIAEEGDRANAYGSLAEQYGLKNHVRSVLRPRARFERRAEPTTEIRFGVTKVEYELKNSPWPFPSWMAGLLLGSWILNLFLLFVLWRGKNHHQPS